jgi:hypothetical protein
MIVDGYEMMHVKMEPVSVSHPSIDQRRVVGV